MKKLIDGCVKFALGLKENFYDMGRWRLLLEGLRNTLVITFFALLVGIVLGAVIAAIRASYDKNRESMALRKGIGYYILKFFNGICHVYLTVIRGTPMTVQALIMFMVILKGIENIVVVAIITFGINSGAYVAEILRGGIMSIDEGQFEAGRSLGFNYVQTMIHIIIPQVIKNVLPALGNEFIVLLKETSIASWLGVVELTKAGNDIINQTFDTMVILIGVAAVYLVLVMILTSLVRLLERRLRRSER